MNDRPNDGIKLFERVILALFCILSAGAFTLLVLSLEKQQPPPAKTLPQLAVSRSAFDHALDGLEHQHPLPYAATVTQSGDGIKEPRTRFYVPKDRR